MQSPPPPQQETDNRDFFLLRSAVAYAPLVWDGTAAAASGVLVVHLGASLAPLVLRAVQQDGGGTELQMVNQDVLEGDVAGRMDVALPFAALVGVLAGDEQPASLKDAVVMQNGYGEGYMPFAQCLRRFSAAGLREFVEARHLQAGEDTLERALAFLRFAHRGGLEAQDTKSKKKKAKKGRATSSAGSSPSLRVPCRVPPATCAALTRVFSLNARVCSIFFANCPQ